MAPFTTKHDSGTKPDPIIKDKIFSHIKGNELPCAVAFQIAGELGVSPGDIGKTADLIHVRLVKCQLGLFGYAPEKKIIKPLETIDPGIESAIQKAAIDKRLSCENAWNIAVSLNVHKMTISGTCEAIGMKINKCQLGAF